MPKNLLVIDWDFFFYNPMEAGARDDRTRFFDWGHAEAPFFRDAVWPMRAAGFLASGLPLPQTKGWDDFAEHFRLADNVEIAVSDSNAWTGKFANDGFDDVWLFDAHHDCGYDKVTSFHEWQRENTSDMGMQFSCEDWMLAFQHMGAKLHYRYPSWHRRYRRKGVEVPKGVILDADMADLTFGTTLPAVTFDAVSICRSGAWVPPWCDADFDEFLSQWGDWHQVDDVPLYRDWHTDYAKQEIQERDMLRAATEGTTK